MSAIGVIGGTGVYDPSIFENIHEESLMTPYGEIDYVQGSIFDFMDEEEIG